MSNTLLPCPFCGGKAAVWDKSRYDTCVRCDGCNAQTNWLPTISDAIAAWNRRTGKDINVATNADRIRSMSDEELARWLVDATICERVCDEDEYCHGNECVKRVTDWLQQPVKEEHNETD